MNTKPDHERRANGGNVSEQSPREDAGAGGGGGAGDSGAAGAGAGGETGAGAGDATSAGAGGETGAGAGAGASTGAAKLLAAIRKTVGVEQVFGPAYERGDVSVIPVAYVVGAGGAGEGLARLVSDSARRLGIGKWALFTRGSAAADSGSRQADPRPDSDQDREPDSYGGSGSGDDAGNNSSAGADGHADAGAGLFAVCARPAGAYVIRGDEVEWKPAWSLTAAIVGTQAVSVAVTAAAACVLRAKVKRRR